MDRQRALTVLQDLLDSFPPEEILADMQADAGPGYRSYASGRLTDAEVREAREALEVLREG